MLNYKKQEVIFLNLKQAKSELHLHLDGSIRPSSLLEICKEKNISIPATSLQEVTRLMEVPENCDSLNTYLKRFDLPLMILQDGESIERVTYELAEDLTKEGIEYGEIRFAPFYSTKNGLTQEMVTKAAINGAKKAMKNHPNIRIGLILCCMRGLDEDINLETVKVCSNLLGDVVCAIDLAGAEALYPTSDYKYIFDKAKDAHIPFTIHAGEAAGPESIYSALEFGTKRIGHGVRCIEDSNLMKQLKEREIILEVCPTSNCQTFPLKKASLHPIRKLFDSGIKITLNTDNRTVSHTSLNKEIELLKNEFGFTESEFDTIWKNAQEARFLK